jgi:UDP-N-acetylmuramate dehydrogenase
MKAMLKFQDQYPLRTHTTFAIGGTATHFIEVNTIEMMQEVMKHCNEHQLRYFILGKGSNTLFDDQGFDGLVILNKIAFIDNPSPTIFHVGAGYSFSLLGAQTARQGLHGLEFASGIPGSVGGAVFMNAGANGYETAMALTSVDFVDATGQLIQLSKEQLSFSYRHSSFHDMPGAIVGATFTLTTESAAKERQLEIINYRMKTQPYKAHSAGCVFRNPMGCRSAGALIEQSGLKGFSIGDAEVSMVHGNFIVNKGNASAQDVLALITHVQEKVKTHCTVDLECEIRYVPYRAEAIQKVDLS